MVSPDQIISLCGILEGVSRVAVVCHSHPDGDAVGSAGALASYLAARCGKDALAILPDDASDALSFISGPLVLNASRKPAEAAAFIGSCDLLVCVDMNAFDRAGALEPLLASCGARKLLIDHHLNPDRGNFDLVFSEIGISSASELVFWILSMMPGEDGGKSLPADVAMSLMTGMTTDTNNFANSVFPSTLRMASILLEAGVDRDAIISNLYNGYRENRVRAMGFFLSELLHITPDGVACMVLTDEVRKRFDLREGETEGFVNIPLSIDRVRMSLLLKEDDGFFRVSIRSKKGVSANRLAKQCFNGGGHELAAGGKLFFPGDIASRDEAEVYVENVTARFLRETAPGK